MGNAVSDEIMYNAKLADVTAALEATKTIGRVSASFSNRSGAAMVCDRKNSLTVEFLTEFGDLPNLVAAHKKSFDMEMNIPIAEVTKGTKESLECSQMGRCNREIGMCTCKEG